METPIIQTTDDGSATLFLPEMNEHYHSVKGALTEALHVYIEMAFKQITSPVVNVFEVGFGTGLNAFLTLLEAEKTGKQVIYTSLELYPLYWQQVKQLDYPGQIAPESATAFEALHTVLWESHQVITPGFTLHKVNQEWSQYIPDQTYDVIYFDAFAPEKQPGLWEEKIFVKCYNSLSPRGVLSTYCAKGEVRRRMQRAGFTVERLPGPIGGKREILRAVKGKR